MVDGARVVASRRPLTCLLTWLLTYLFTCLLPGTCRRPPAALASHLRPVVHR